MAKTYQLMAWTDKGQVKMVPSLVAELAGPYVQRIQAVEQEPRARGRDEETAQLLRLSRAHEALAGFFLRVGYWEDAFLQFVDAAMAASYSSDDCWDDAEVGFLLHAPLAHRFLAMYERCRQIAEDHPAIMGSLQWHRLQKEWREVTDVHRIWSAEFREVTLASTEDGESIITNNLLYGLK